MVLTFSKKSFDANAFLTSTTAAGYITPEIWSRKIYDIERNNVVLEPLMIKNTELLNKPGDTLHISVDVALSADSVAETDAVSVSAISYTQVNITTNEYGVSVEASKSVLEDSYLTTLQMQSANMGKGLALKKDSVILAALVAGAGSSVLADDVAATSDLTSSNTLDIDDVINAATELRKDNVEPLYLVINAEMFGDLIKNDKAYFIDASAYGSTEVRMNGEIGKFYGLKTFVTQQIAASSNVSTGLVLGNEAGIVAQKRLPTFEADYDPIYRKYTLVATERYGFGVLKSTHICTLAAYTA